MAPTDTAPLPLVEARIAVAIYEHGKRALQQAIFAALVVTGDQLHCPYCGQSATAETLSLVELDEHTSDVTGHDTTDHEVYLAETRPTSHGAYCTISCCDAPVSLPEHWSFER